MPFNLSGSDITSSFVQVSNFSGWANFPTAASLGNNSYGQLGVTTVTTNISSPVVIGTISTVYTGWVDASYLRSGTGLALINQNNQSLFAGQPLADTANRSTPVQVGTLSGWTSIANGSFHTFALRNNGTMWSWGSNSFGQLGVNTSVGTGYSSPVQIGALSIWTQITAGSYSSYAVQSNGTLWSWGVNSFGQLGNNSTTNRSSPAQVGSAGGIWKIISGSGSTMLGVQSNGTLWYWGNNSFAQFGDFSTNPQSSPVQQFTGTWVNVASAPTHTLGIQSNGTLWAWGNNSYGQLGLNNLVSQFTPVQVGTASSWAQISTGTNASIAIQSDGTLWAWGMNTFGQLGLGDTTDRSSPVQISSTTKWTSIINGAISGFFMAAIQSNGTLWTWGNNSFGQLGTSDQINYSSPVQVGTLSTWTEVSAGNLFMVGLQNNGTMWAWGNNSLGQLGTQNFNHRSSPVQVLSANNNLWNSIYACGYSVLATQNNGSVWSWGTNSYGQLGTSNRTNYYSPIQISSYGASGWKTVSGTILSGAIIQSNGNLWTFGLNSWGQLGNGNQVNYSSPVQIGARPWARIASAELNFHFLAVQDDGSLWGWGNNSFGQLGAGSAGANIISPVQIGSAYNNNIWRELYLVPWNSFGIQSPGTLWAWGSNSYGQLGNNSFGTNIVSPIQVGTESYWAQVACGELFVVATQSNGTLWAWGNNSYGQLGTGNQTNYSSPVQIGTLSNWSQLDTSTQFTLATQSNGTLWAWGYNNLGQLGTNNQITYSSPVQVGTQSNWAQLASGAASTTAIQSNGTLWAWGFNAQGQLGLANPAGFPTSAYPTQYLNNTFGGFKKVTASASQAYYQSVNDTILQASVADIPAIDSTNTISWNSYDTGQYHFVGVKDNGTAWSIGNNSYGQLGFPTLTTSIFTASNIKAGHQSAFAITSAGTLWAWGNNSFGQLGTSNQTNYSSPTQVGTVSNWATVAPSFYFTPFTVATQSNGTLWAWGANTYGQLGLNDTTDRISPVQVGATSIWSQLSTGWLFTSAIQNDGTLWSWGSNTYGSLGINTTTLSYSSPVQIGTENYWAKLSTGIYQTLAIQSNGTLWSWGYNGNGQLGLSDQTNRSSPVQVGTQSNWSQISGGGLYSAGIQSNGTLWTWGYGVFGQLGNNSTANCSTPVQVGTTSTWTQVSCGYAHTAALQSNGTLWVWGLNSYGQIGINNTGNFSNPIQISGNSNWTQVSCGYFYTTAKRNDNTLWAWGTNSYGQLGVNTSVNYSSPVQVGTTISGSSTITTLTQIGSSTNWSTAICADYGSMLIDNSNNAWVFGNNNQYQLGFSDTTNRSSPVQIIGPTGIKTAAMDNNNICLIDNNNNLWMGGTGNSNNFNAQLPATDVSRPIQVGAYLNQWTQVSAGWQFAVALKNDGTIWSWGTNAQGQGGISDLTFRSSPVQIGTASYWSQISCGYGHTLALQNNGTLWAWGFNTSGQLGNGGITNISSPVQIGALSTWAKISAGEYMSGAIQSNGTLWSWGQNNFGQLGQSNITNRSSPTQVGILSTWTQVDGAWFNMAAIKSDGTLWMWGNNAFGQLCLGDLTNRSSPVQLGTLSTWSQISCGYSAWATQSNGTLWAWGNNSWGQLGQNNQTNYSSPVQVGILSVWSSIATAPAPGYSAAVIQSDGTLWAWGNNSWGQLGTSNQTHYSSPVQMGTNSNWAQVASSGGNGTSNFFTSGIQSNGTLWAWGSNALYTGQLGRLANYPYLYQQSTNNSWSSVKTNQNTTLLIATNNTFWSYGSNTFGQLGSTPSTIYQFALAQINALNTGTKIETKAGSSTIFNL